MKWIDRFSENSARSMARQSSRRSFVARLGTLMLGAAAVPLLPVARGDESSRLLALLRHRRVSLRLLRWKLQQLPTRDDGFTDYLDWYLQQPG